MRERTPETVKCIYKLDRSARGAQETETFILLCQSYDLIIMSISCANHCEIINHATASQRSPFTVFSYNTKLNHVHIFVLSY